MKAAEIVPFDPKVITLIRRVLSVAETDKPEWDPSATYVYRDGNNDRRQCTLSIGFTADGGNLTKVLEAYVQANGSYSAQLSPWITALKAGSAGTDPDFLKLLAEMGKHDPLFLEVQKQAFDDLYLGPAFQWAKEHGLALPLSFLVVADSYLHSGGMLSVIRNMFEEPVPSNGGDEKRWTTAYANARYKWLKNHSKQILHTTVYRIKCYQEEIAKDNWTLEKVPLVMNDTKVTYG